MENKKIILLDVDEVVCETGFLPLLNKFLGTSYELDDFTNYFIEEEAILDEALRSDFYKYFARHDSYQYAKLKPGAREVLKELNELYDIRLCSACIISFLMEESGDFFAHKYHFLRRELPFIDLEKMILTNTKDIFRADIQIDDRLHHLQSHIPTKYLFDAYHNRNISDSVLKSLEVERANNWYDLGRRLIRR
ncbi:MAG TPA: hypothetical protein PLT65_01780 [Bacilli bacterium]|nr:hypothetical protein [Bacilli bacterium]